MAVIQYSALVTQLRGKLGGSQFNKGHAGYSLQRKSTPTIRQTPSQLAWRQTVSLVQRSWKTETIERRNQAAQAAVSNPTTDRFGQQVVLSGYNHYVKMMSWRRLAGIPLSDNIITTPVNAVVTELLGLTVSLVGFEEPNTFVFSLSCTRSTSGSPTGGIAGSRLGIYFTKVNAQGVPVRPLRKILVFAAATANNALLTTTQRIAATSVFYNIGDFILVDVEVRNTLAGAVTGHTSQIVTIT